MELILDFGGKALWIQAGLGRVHVAILHLTRSLLAPWPQLPRNQAGQ